MSAAQTLTITCPHCAQPLRARASHAGRHVRCPNLACRQPVAVPLPLDDEPPAPKPRKPRRVEDDELEAQPRAALWPWALAAGVLLVVVGAAAGWAFVALEDKPTGGPKTVAVVENRQPQADDPKARGRSGEPRPAPAAPKGLKEPETNPEPKPAEIPHDPPPRPPARPVPADPEFRPPVPVRPNPWVPARPEVPPDAKPGAGAAFVGTWEMVRPDLQKAGVEVTMEFRTDGGCSIRIGGKAVPDTRRGTWQWDGQKLHIVPDEAADRSKPAEVKWNGPDEFTLSSDGAPVTLRRKNDRK